MEVQRDMANGNIHVPETKRIEFRIGVHVGDIIIDDNDIFGDGVNIAARLEGIADPAGICISDDAYRQIRGKTEIAYDDLGHQTLKNISEPMRAWRARSSGAAAAMQPLKVEPRRGDRKCYRCDLAKTRASRDRACQAQANRETGSL